MGYVWCVNVLCDWFICVFVVEGSVCGVVCGRNVWSSW